MKLLTFLFLLVSFSAHGQQNFFNIPSGQITPKEEFFYQHQVNAFSPRNLASKQHVVYGVGKNSEVGFNFVNYYPNGKTSKEIEGSPGPLTNILAPTFQHAVFLSDDLTVNIGGQYGTAHVGSSGVLAGTGMGFGALSYYHPESHFRVTGGAWISDVRFNGPGTKEGFLFGGEWMFADGTYVMGDWVSGDTKNSVSVIGGMVDVAKGFQLCLGALVPNKRSKEGDGVVFEVNAFTY